MAGLEWPDACSWVADDMKSRSLLAQVLAVNLLLVAATMLFATIALHQHVAGVTENRELMVLGLAVLATMLADWILLRRRFMPLDQLIRAMEQLDPAAPATHSLRPHRLDSSDVRRLDAAFQRMVGRLDGERRAAGRAVIQAQERERRRIAQDLHDAPPDLRRELEETKRLSTQAMKELLALARQLRPAVLDDHGLIPALHSQVQVFSDQTGVLATFNSRGQMSTLTPEQQLVVYRVTQESLSNIAQHAEAHKVDVELSFIGRTMLRISDDGRGFTASRDGGLGLSGMRERARLVGGELSIWSGPGTGTRVELTLQ
jgi:two-component system sensor histidine kinase UhpB